MISSGRDIVATTGIVLAIISMARTCRAAPRLSPGSTLVAVMASITWSQAAISFARPASIQAAAASALS